MFRRYKISYKHTFSGFIALKYRFLRERDNVTSVFYILNKIDFSLTLYSFNIIRLSLAWFSRGIYFHINVFFLYIYFLFT